MRLFEGTDYDRPPTCERCGQLEQDCACPPPPPPPKQLTPPEQQRATLALEKRKKGKVVTVIRGLPAAENDLSDLFTKLKTACGAGGAVKGDVIEIQGDHRQRTADVLQGLGFRVTTR